MRQKQHLNVSRHEPDTKAKQCTAKDNYNSKPFSSSFSKEKIRSLHRRLIVYEIIILKNRFERKTLAKSCYLLLKSLYQVKKVNGHMYAYLGYRLCPFPHVLYVYGTVPTVSYFCVCFLFLFLLLFFSPFYSQIQTKINFFSLILI